MKRRDRKGQELHENIQKRRIKPLPRQIKKDIHKRTYIQKEKNNKKKRKKNKNTTTTDIHNNKKLRNLYTGNIHPTPTHMIAEPFDSSVRNEVVQLMFHR